MANALYGKGRQRYQTGGINVLSDTIKVCLVQTSGGYTVAIDTHEFWSDVGTSARVATPVTLSSKTADLGAFDAADATFSSVSGSAIGAIIIFKDTGTEATSPLLAYIDTATGLPITPNGGDKRSVTLH